MIDHDSGNATVRYGRVRRFGGRFTWWFIQVSKWVITPVIVFLLVSQIHEATRRFMCGSDVLLVSRH